MKWDKVKIQSLLSVGADPDMNGRKVVGGALARELQVTTARQLAQALGRQHIVTLFEKVNCHAINLISVISIYPYMH